MEDVREKKCRLTGYPLAMTILAGATVILNILACIRPFCDFYKLYIYGIISDVLGVATSWFGVALGELLMYLGAAALLVGIAVAVAFIFLKKKAGYRKFAAIYWKSILGVFLTMLLIYTLNWVIPFRANLLKVSGATERGYSLEEVRNVRNHIVNQLNACALEVERGEDGKVLYPENVDAKVFAAMKAKADVYPLLSGFYPPMKAALCSDFLEWMWIGGYTYPYTMELTYNKYVTDFYYPTLLAHEASHHQGYYQENEATFLSFLACAGSEDPLLRYSAYDQMYYYFQNTYLETLSQTMDLEGIKAELAKQPKVSDLVKKDRADSEEAAEEKYQADEHPAQELAPAVTQVGDVGWEVQAEVIQENTYDGVVLMVLQYYDVLMGGLKDAF